jgi:hypothetical protein
MLSAKFKSAVESVRVMALSSAQTSPSGDRETIFRGGDTLTGNGGGKWNMKVKQPGGMATYFGSVKEEEVEKEESSDQPSPRNGLYRMFRFDPDAICGCRVGSAGYVCAAAEIDCRVKSHKLKVVDLPLTDHYGLCKVTDSVKGPATMLGDLFVPVEVVPQETLDDWEASPALAESWSYRFRSATSAAVSHPNTPAKIRTLNADLAEAAKVLRDEEEETSDQSASWSEPEWTFLRRQVQPLLEPDQERSLFENQEFEQRLWTLFDQAATTAAVVDETSEAIIYLKDSQDHEGSRTKTSLESLRSMVKSMSVQLGRRSASSEFATIWGAVDATQDGLGQLAKAVSETAVPKGLDRLLAGIDSLPSRQYVDDCAMEGMDQIKKWVEVFVEHHQPDLTELVEHKKDMEQVVSDIADAVAPLPSRVTDNEVELARLVSRMSLMEKDLQTVRAPNKTVFGLSGSSSSSGTDPMIQQQLDAINKMLQDLILRKDEMVVTYGGVSYRSTDDVTSWLKTHHPKYNYDLFFDPLIILRRINGPGDADNLFKRYNYQKCAGMTNDDEASAIMAMNQECPEVFHKGEPIISRCLETSPFSKLKKYSEWSSGTGGLKSALKAKLGPLQLKWKSSIARAYANNPVMLVMCTTMLTDSHTFLLALFDFVDEQYHQLEATSKFGAEQSWALCVGLMWRILADLFTPKNGFASELSLDNREETCVIVFWTSLLTLRETAHYMKDGIAKHPSIASESVAFLTLRSGSEKVDAAADLAMDLSTKFKLMEKDVKAMSTKADTATQKCQELAKQVQKLQSKSPKKD